MRALASKSPGLHTRTMSFFWWGYPISMAKAIEFAQPNARFAENIEVLRKQLKEWSALRSARTTLSVEC
jgi:hypothetical protein